MVYCIIKCIQVLEIAGVWKDEGVLKSFFLQLRILASK